MQRAVTRSPGRGRTRAGAAGVLGGVPRIAAELVETGKAGGKHAVIRAGRLGVNNRAILTAASGHRRVLYRGHQFHRPRAKRHRMAFRGDQFLQRDRNAIEGPERFAFLPTLRRGQRLPACIFRIIGVKRIHHRFESIDARLHRLPIFRWRKLPLPVKRQDFERVEVYEIGHGIVSSEKQEMGATAFLSGQLVSRGSSRSRRPSPRRLRPKTASAIARPGMMASQGAVPR